MADINKFNFYTDGTEISFSSASSGDTLLNNGEMIVIVQNNGSSSREITFATTATVEGETVSDKTVTLSADTTGIYGPFDKQNFNNDNGKIDISYSDTTSVNIAAVRPSGL